VTTLLNTTNMTVWKNIVPSIPITFGNLNPAKVTKVVCGKNDVRGCRMILASRGYVSIYSAEEGKSEW